MNQDAISIYPSDSNPSATSTLDSTPSSAPLSSAPVSEQLQPNLNAITAAVDSFIESVARDSVLNEENADFLFNNFFTRLENKKSTTPEQKKAFSDFVKKLDGFEESLDDLPKPTADVDKEDQALLNAMDMSEQQTQLLTSLENVVLENQAQLIEEEKSVEFLERNQSYALEELKRHVETYEPSELLTLIFEINESMPENNRFENNPKLYLSPGVFSGLKVSLFSDTPKSIQKMQQLVKQYDNPQKLGSDLQTLKNFLASSNTLEIAAMEAGEQLDKKNKEIEVIIDSIKSYQSKIDAVSRERLDTIEIKDRLLKDSPQSQALQFLQSVEYVKNNWVIFFEANALEHPVLGPLIEKTFSSDAKTKIPKIVQTYLNMHTGLDNLHAELQSVADTTLEYASHVEFNTKRNTAVLGTTQLEALQKPLQTVLGDLQGVRSQYDEFAKTAFDSNLEDYLDASLKDSEFLNDSFDALQAIHQKFTESTHKIAHLFVSTSKIKP